MWQLLFDNNYLPPAKICLVWQTALYHILVSADEEVSLCNHSLLLAQVLLGAIWQILAGAPLCHHPEQTSDMHFVKTIIFSSKGVSTKPHRVLAILDHRTKPRDLLCFPPLKDQNSHIWKHQEATVQRQNWKVRAQKQRTTSARHMLCLCKVENSSHTPSDGFERLSEKFQPYLNLCGRWILKMVQNSDTQQSDLSKVEKYVRKQQARECRLYMQTHTHLHRG